MPTRGQPDAELTPSLLAASDVLGTGWFAAVAANAGPGNTVAVVGDGAVGLLGILAAKQLGAERIIAMSRPGGYMGFVGVNYEVSLRGIDVFFSGIHLHGGPAPVRRFLPHLLDLILDRKIDPGRVFDVTLPLEKAADGYKAMNERRATKVLLTL